MLVVGGYFALVLPLSFTLLASSDISLPPLALEVYQYPTNLMLWAGAVVMVLGMVHLLWPSARSVTAGATPEPSANRGQVSSEP